ncbi:unnamed protein product [Clonostachys byssicola]|uniref:Uncharacterized protein n=1 Tax=Clonostachys byssicola TaxID=160290 RepID=A0A9N9UGC2_9HYPO|nr:unnamed protein product [Clonostachys byssicola]
MAPGYPARRKAPPSAYERQQKLEMKAARKEKAQQDHITSLSLAWSGQGWIPDDIRNCPPSFMEPTDVRVLRPLWRITLKAVSRNISLPSLWQPGGILLLSYNENGFIWRKNLMEAARDESWCLGAPRLESNQSTERTDHTNLADTVKASDQDKTRDAFATKDQPMEDGSTAESQETRADISSNEASIRIWELIEIASIEDLEEQILELKSEAQHATISIKRKKEQSDNIRGKIAAFSDFQSKVMSSLDDQLRRPETSTPDTEEHVKFLKDASQQRRLSLDKELAEVLNEERDSNRDLGMIREMEKLVEHILNYKAAVQRLDTEFSS